MSDARLREAERAVKADHNSVTVRALNAETCRVYWGHEIESTLWISRGELRNVHGCFCGAYNEPCGGAVCARCGGRAP